MAAAGNPCPIKGCTAHAKLNQLMCWPHWKRVPRALNHAVFETFRNISRDPEAYRQARDAAIAAVEAKEAAEAKKCAHCGDRSITNLDGDELCQTHANAWSFGEGQALAEQEAREREHGREDL